MHMRNTRRALRVLGVAAVLTVGLLAATPAGAHVARVESFSVSPTTVEAGKSFTFSARVYGWHSGHSYYGWTRVFRGTGTSGTRLWGIRKRYPNQVNQYYNLSGSITAESTTGTRYVTIRQCVVEDGTCATQTVSYTVKRVNHAPANRNSLPMR